MENTFKKRIDQFKDFFMNDDLVRFREFKSKDSYVRFCAIYIEGMVDREVLNESFISSVMNAQIGADLHNQDIINHISSKVISCGDIQTYNLQNDFNKIVSDIEYGYTALLIQNASDIMIINTKGWSSRNIAEPTSEAVVKGPREGFTESILTNITMIRRKILNNSLKFEMMDIGSLTKTQICVSYIDGVCNKKILQEVKKRLSKIKIDAVLESEYIMELIRDEPLSIFQTVGNTERPDIVAAKLIEGKIVILCDGTPFALTMPYLFVENFHVNEDYYRNYVIALANRLLKILCFILSVSVPGLYIALVNYQQQLIPTKLFVSFSVSREGIPFPSVIEILVMLIAFEILREAGTRLPKNIGNTVSIVGALILGQAAVEARLVSAPIIIISAITGITGFTVPKMAGSVFAIRFILLLLSSIFGIYGYIWGTICVIVYLMSMRSFGMNYMTFLTEFNPEDVQDTGIRIPWFFMNYDPYNSKAKKIERKISQEKGSKQ